MSGEFERTRQEMQALTEASMRHREELRKGTEQVKKAAKEFTPGKIVQALQRGASGIGGALSAAGSGGADVAVAGAKAFTDAAPQIGQKMGMAAAGPLGAVLGQVVGVGVGTALERTLGPMIQARDSGISQVAALTSARAQAGIATSPEALSALLEGAMTRAMRSNRNEAAVREAANDAGLLARVFGGN